MLNDKHVGLFTHVCEGMYGKEKKKHKTALHTLALQQDVKSRYFSEPFWGLNYFSYL